MALDEASKRGLLRDSVVALEGVSAMAVTKDDIKAALQGIDDYLDSPSGANAINQSIPQPARSNLSTVQKAALLSFVVSHRWGR